MLRRVELNPMNQKMLEEKKLARIREINGFIKKNKETYEHWDEVTDARLLKYGKEGYKAQFIDYWFNERSRVVEVLNHQIRKGFIYE